MTWKFQIIQGGNGKIESEENQNHNEITIEFVLERKYYFQP